MDAPARMYAGGPMVFDSDCEILYSSVPFSVISSSDATVAVPFLFSASVLQFSSRSTLATALIPRNG